MVYFLIISYFLYFTLFFICFCFLPKKSTAPVFSDAALLLYVLFLLFLDFGQFVENHIVQNLDVGAFHSAGAGLDDARTLEFSKGVDDNGTGDAHAVCDLAGNQDTFHAVQLVKDVNDGFQLGEGKGVDGRFYDLDLAVLLRVLLMNGTHHLKTYNGRTVFT